MVTSYSYFSTCTCIYTCEYICVCDRILRRHECCMVKKCTNLQDSLLCAKKEAQDHWICVYSGTSDKGHSE